MPPNYRQQQGHAITSAERKGAVVLAGFVVACASGLGAWGLTGGFGTASTQKCVYVVVGSATGGGDLRTCGSAAKPWCATESTAPGDLGPAVLKACRQQGFLPGRPKS